MGLTIERADNGWVLTYHEQDDEGNERKHYIAVEEPNDGDEAETTYKLLGEILEHFGLWGSKHDNRRIHIEVQNQKE